MRTPGGCRRSRSVMRGSCEYGLAAVIPGWSAGPDPESRDSGFDASHRPGMTTLGGGATAVDGVGGARGVARLVGIRLTIFSVGGGSLPGLRPCRIVLSIRLSIRPGQTQLTRTPVPVHSQAAL